MNSTLLMSNMPKEGHLVLLRVPGECKIMVRYFDDNSTRDITAFAPELILTGMQEAKIPAPKKSDIEEVTVASVFLTDAPEGLLPIATYLHIPSKSASDLTFMQLETFLAAGLTLQVTAGIAYEAVDVPDDTVGIDPPLGA